MKKLTALAAAVAALALAGTAAAVSLPTVIHNCAVGAPLVTVPYGLVTDYDSGFAGNAWANATIDRHLQVWSTGPGTYCATVEDHGSFVTFAGPSPSGTSTVSAGVRGVIGGGYVTTTFTGTFAPSLPTRGNLGTFDLQCTSVSNCPGAHPSFTSYFSSTGSWDLAAWGWAYFAGRHGTWVNAYNVSAADGGDITG